MVIAAVICLIVGLWRGTSKVVRHFLGNQEIFAKMEGKVESQTDGEETAGEEGQSQTDRENAATGETEGEKSQTDGENAAGWEFLEDVGDEERLLLVNKYHPLDEDYQPELVEVQDYGVEVDEAAYGPLLNMLAAGEQEGLRFWIASAYRSPAKQRELLDEDIGELVGQGFSYSEAYEEVTRETMPVGCSEHATGLAVDIVARDYQVLDEEQEQTEEIRWLQENCWQYGFILRYPSGKEDVTLVDYESWHFRYVGKKAAETIMAEEITLEEYLEEQ